MGSLSTASSSQLIRKKNQQFTNQGKKTKSGLSRKPVIGSESSFKMEGNIVVCSNKRRNHHER
jgi:hypothetical protein